MIPPKHGATRAGKGEKARSAFSVKANLLAGYAGAKRRVLRKEGGQGRKPLSGKSSPRPW